VPPFASEQFHAITSANPEGVWNALTATGVSLDYLHGMTVDTDWQPGARVTMALRGPRTATFPHEPEPAQVRHGRPGKVVERGPLKSFAE
jgi:hypothetical protein